MYDDLMHTLINYNTGTIALTQVWQFVLIKRHANYTMMLGYHNELRIMTDSTAYPEFAMAGMGFGGGGMAGAAAGGPMPPSMTDNGALASVDRVRNVFPETWLWSNTTTGYMK